jgi:hypothetical protein
MWRTKDARSDAESCSFPDHAEASRVISIRLRTHAEFVVSAARERLFARRPKYARCDAGQCKTLLRDGIAQYIGIFRVTRRRYSQSPCKKLHHRR